MENVNVDVKRLVELRDYMKHRFNVTFPEVINDEDTPRAMRMAYEGKLEEYRWIIDTLNNIIGDKENH